MRRALRIRAHVRTWVLVGSMQPAGILGAARERSPFLEHKLERRNLERASTEHRLSSTVAVAAGAKIARRKRGGLTNGSQPRDTNGINLHSCLRPESPQNQGERERARARQNIPAVKRAWTRAAMFHRGIVGRKKRKKRGREKED